MRRILLVCLLFLPLGACGGGGDKPGAGPDPVVNLTLTGPEGPYYIGSTYTFTASASGGTWGNDAPTIVSVNNGVVNGLASGEVTIWVDVRGQRATKRLRVMPNYAGSWIGSYIIRSCSDSGQMRSLVEFCGDGFGVNHVLPIYATLTQQSDVVTGTWSLGTLNMDQATGPVSMPGGLAMATSRRDNVADIQLHINAQSTTAGRITGRIQFIFRPTNGLSGEARVEADLQNVNHSVGIIAPMSVGSPSTTQDLLRAITGGSR